jgi:small multidrug resistance pump
LVVTGYAISLGLLALVVREVPVSVAYAVWSGLGTAVIALIGVAFLGETLSLLKASAIVMIAAGVVMLNLSGAH